MVLLFAPAEFPASMHVRKFACSARAALPVLGGWVFLASILDLYARRVVGWALSESN